MSGIDRLKVGFIGGGAMASALAKGIGAAKLIPYSQMYVSDLNPSALTDLSSLGMHVSQDNGIVASECDAIFLCTKPDQVVPALGAVVNKLKPSPLLISVAAGLPLAALQSVTPPRTKLVRVMPNTPALIGAGASAFCMGEACTDSDAKLVQKLLGSVGFAVRVAEKDINPVTGLSASGPAYVFLFLEALADGGVRSGLTRPVAQQLALETVLGSAKLMQSTGKHPGQLKDQVASPGGTTIAGIHALEQGGFRGVVIDAVLAATERAHQLGAASDKLKSKL